jgi:hypothetical protein
MELFALAWVGFYILVIVMVVGEDALELFDKLKRKVIK